MISYKILDPRKSTPKAPSPVLNDLFLPTATSETQLCLRCDCELPAPRAHPEPLPAGNGRLPEQLPTAIFSFTQFMLTHMGSRLLQLGFIALVILMTFGAFSVLKDKRLLPSSQGQTPAYPAGQPVTSHGGSALWLLCFQHAHADQSTNLTWVKHWDCKYSTNPCSTSERYLCSVRFSNGSSLQPDINFHTDKHTNCSHDTLFP